MLEFIRRSINKKNDGLPQSPPARSKWFDVDMDYLSGINETAQGKYGVQVDEHHVVFSGVCLQCKN